MSLVKQKQICKNLENLIEKILSCLVAMGEDPSQYTGLNKIKRIAESCDVGGFRNLTHYLDSDSRTIYDNRLYNTQLENYVELAYKEISKL
ncbi:hypothetical protein [Legionella saoudiensis]|uniref:hypothetical protein n=1 Tax=Legionella saoudiensis TaxID=1750561 RepID=UPI0007304AFB|nr:hypothetical protein [Legionella saoudiensis]